MNTEGKVLVGEAPDKVSVEIQGDHLVVWKDGYGQHHDLTDLGPGHE